MEEIEAGGADTRGRLLGAAADLLEKGGVEAVTLRAVGERAGVSRQAPYRHFADKQELLSAVAAGYFRRLGEAMEEARQEAADPLGGLEAMGEAYVRFALASPDRHRLMFGAETKASAHAGMHAAARAVYEKFVWAVSECQQAGELPGNDPVQLAALIYATSHGAVDLTLRGQREVEKGLGDPARLVRSLLDFIGRS